MKRYLREFKLQSCDSLPLLSSYTRIGTSSHSAKDKTLLAPVGPSAILRRLYSPLPPATCGDFIWLGSLLIDPPFGFMA